jgi:hypothetical protein
MHLYAFMKYIEVLYHCHYEALLSGYVQNLEVAHLILILILYLVYSISGTPC